MKRIRTLVLVTMLVSVAALSFAEYQVLGKDVFPVSRDIAMIYAYRLGYKIIFQKEDTNFGSFYVPLSWFGKAGGKGELVWGNEPAYPRFTVFYVDGKFSHIRLYVRPQTDSTWAVLAPTEAEEKKFDIDTLEISY